jgi:hypothetical protein
MYREIKIRNKGKNKSKKRWYYGSERKEGMWDDGRCDEGEGKRIDECEMSEGG